MGAGCGFTGGSTPPPHSRADIGVPTEPEPIVPLPLRYGGPAPGVRAHSSRVRYPPNHRGEPYRERRCGLDPLGRVSRGFSFAPYGVGRFHLQRYWNMSGHIPIRGRRCALNIWLRYLDRYPFQGAQLWAAPTSLHILATPTYGTGRTTRCDCAWPIVYLDGTWGCPCG